ncbi:MAG: hypothetical protein WD511_00710 [Balneolaceae bacterium]
MSFLSDGRKIVADIKYTNIFGKKGVGVHQLIFQVELMLKAWKEFTTVLRNLSVEVIFVDKENNEHFLGIATPEKPFLEITPQENDREAYADLRLILSPHQIELIEDIRKGEDFRFKMKISCELNTRFFDDQSDINRSQVEEYNKIVNQSEWINALEKMDYGKYFLLEVPIPEVLNSKIPKNIHAELLSAQRHFIKGHYEVTVGKCRKVLELLDKLLADESKMSKSMNSFKGTKNVRDSMSKEERFYMIRKVVYHYTHLAHHSETDGSITQFSRIEAQQILTMVTSVLAYFVSEYGSME